MPKHPTSETLRLEGEFESGRVYLVERAALRMGVGRAWVMDNIIRPKDRQGCPVLRVGTRVFIVGEDFLRWVQDNARQEGGNHG